MGRLSRTQALIFLAVLASGLSSNAQSAEARTASIDRILADYRDDQAKLDPEAASLSGDKRFNDQLPDFSVAAANSTLSRGQTYIQRLSEVDSAGAPDNTRLAVTSLLNRLVEEQASDRANTWQRPLEQFTQLHTELLDIAAKLPFTSVKDYDDYITRLHKLPFAFSQIMTNIQLTSDSGRPLPKAQVAATLSAIQSTISQPAKSSPLAAPLQRFPPSISPADRGRITTDLLNTITDDVIPGYQRISRFITAHDLPQPSRTTVAP